MIADLLEAHQEREHDAPALNALGLRQLVAHVVDGLLIERSLRAAEWTERFNFCFIRQVGNNGLVSLETPQDVRPDEFAQRSVRSMRAVGEALGELGELLG